MNPLVNILDFGPTPQGSGGGTPPPPTGTDYQGHQPPILIGLTQQYIDFGWTPEGTSGGIPPPPTGTDYLQHEQPILIGLSRQFIDFGWRPGIGAFVPPPPGTDNITDTTKLQLPINCVLAGQQDYEVGKTEIESRDPNIKTRVKLSSGAGGKIAGPDPSFTVKTSKTGH